MPKALIYAVMVLAILALIPPALIARTRAVNNKNRRIHLIQDMDHQGKFGPQDTSDIFTDRRAMRPPVEGAVAREDAVREDNHYYRGVISGADGKPAWATAYPRQMTVDLNFIRRGQERFNIYCRPCHGYGGYGDGIVNERAMQLMSSAEAKGTAWVQAKNIHEPLIREQPPGQIFNTITHGIRNMAGYESQIPLDDRWAITAYVKALQFSQHATLQDVPSDQQESLILERLPEGALEAATQAATTPASGATQPQPQTGGNQQ
jgi:hypothetical protein